jgi:hypothetical protein
LTVAVTPEDEQERRTAGLAQAIKLLADDWTNQIRMFAIEAKVAKARYDAHVAAGFDRTQALQLCVKKIEIF